MRNTDELSSKGIIFEAKPDAIPYNYRISYKVSIICLIIYSCCGRRGCSLVKMHIIGSALSDNRFKKQLLLYLRTPSQCDFIVRFDPALNRALAYSEADGLIAQQGNGAYKLTPKGRQLAKEIMDNKEILKLEKGLLEEISVAITEEKIKEISERWKYQNVDNQ